MRAVELFPGHDSFVQGLNVFLPLGSRIECCIDTGEENDVALTTLAATFLIPTLQMLPPLVIRKLLAYLDDVKTDFKNTPEVYDACLDLMNTWNSRRYG